MRVSAQIIPELPRRRTLACGGAQRGNKSALSSLHVRRSTRFSLCRVGACRNGKRKKRKYLAFSCLNAIYSAPVVATLHPSYAKKVVSLSRKEQQNIICVFGEAHEGDNF